MTMYYYFLCRQVQIWSWFAQYYTLVRSQAEKLEWLSKVLFGCMTRKNMIVICCQNAVFKGASYDLKKKIQDLLERFFKCNFRTKVELLDMVKGKSYDILERTMKEQKLEGKHGVDSLRRRWFVDTANVAHISGNTIRAFIFPWKCRDDDDFDLSYLTSLYVPSQ